MEGDRAPYSLFFYTSPYKRSKQTHEEICSAFDHKHLVGSQEEVQLREQVRLRRPCSWCQQLRNWSGWSAACDGSLLCGCWCLAAGAAWLDIPCCWSA